MPPCPVPGELATVAVALMVARPVVQLNAQPVALAVVSAVELAVVLVGRQVRGAMPTLAEDILLSSVEDNTPTWALQMVAALALELVVVSVLGRANNIERSLEMAPDVVVADMGSGLPILDVQKLERLSALMLGVAVGTVPSSAASSFGVPMMICDEG